MSVDPLAPKYPYYTPYQFAGNTPTKFVDLDGREPTEAKLYWKKAPVLREAQGNPTNQAFYQTQGRGGNGKYFKKLYVYEDYSEGTSKFFWYNDVAQQWRQFDPNTLANPDVVGDIAIKAVGVAAAGVGGAVLAEAGAVGFLIRETIEAIAEELTGIPFITINPDPTDIADPVINKAGREFLNLGDDISDGARMIDQPYRNPAAIKKRRAQYNRHSPGWSEGSLKKTVSRYAPGIQGKVSSDGVKTRFFNSKTKVEVIYDNENNYFRLYDHNHKQYVKLDGRVPSTGRLQGENARDFVKSQTHFRNND